jgi:hypothetical protein
VRSGNIARAHARTALGGENLGCLLRFSALETGEGDLGRQMPPVSKVVSFAQRRLQKKKKDDLCGGFFVFFFLVGTPVRNNARVGTRYGTGVFLAESPNTFPQLCTWSLLT